VDEKKKTLIGIVGKENVLEYQKSLEAYAKDQSFVLPMEPWFVVRPKNMEEVQAIVKWANESTTPLVPMSSGAPHFHGDTVPSVPGATLVDLSRMSAIRRIDRRNRMALIEPGVTYSQLQPELAKEGLRLTTPLLPRRTKSVIASLLERQPTTIPRYQYSMTEPLRTLGVVWGNGDILYTGEAGGSVYSLEDQWKAGGRQVDPQGPGQTDYLRFVTGAQGTMGIAVWASVKCELLPEVHKVFFIATEKLEALIEFSQRLQRLRLGDEVLLLNNSQLANILGKGIDHIITLRGALPHWVLIMGVAGRALFPKEKAAVQEKDISDLAQYFGLKLLSAIPGATNREVLDMLINPSGEPYWKLKYKGGCQDIFFLTTLDKTPQFIKTMYSVAETLKYQASEIGIYIQPQHQGVEHHCEFSLPFNPEDSKEVTRVKELYCKASEELIGQGAYFSRPYGMWANMVYNRDAQGTIALRKIKQIFDPKNVMNPGKLCF
jgi:FAD/FMN-containing dehydrogenase